MDQPSEGYIEPRDADIQCQKWCDELMPEVEKRTKKKYNIFRAVLYRRQVVEGVNFLFKVHVGGGDYLHLMVFLTTSGELVLNGVREQGKDDPFEPF